MARRHKLWAAAARARMKLILGGFCASCGSKDMLEFDCIEPAGDRHHRMTAPARISFYRAQMRMGNVQLLCQQCNSLKGDMNAVDWWLAMQRATNELTTVGGVGSPGRGLDIEPDAWRDIVRKYLPV
jgi:hypothetical protein